MSEQVLASIGVAVVIVAAAGVLWAMVWAVCWLVAWVWNWWRFRGDVGDDYTDDDGGNAELELPPERTWEQMTSHQLPLTGSERLRAIEVMDRAGDLSPARERRAPWWEVQQRAAYESLGMEFPSGLMARVRELTP